MKSGQVTPETNLLWQKTGRRQFIAPVTATKHKPQNERTVMKKSILTAFVIAAVAIGSAASVLAEEKTVTGDGACSGSHQTVIKVQDGNKTVTYYLAENDVSKNFHKKICQAGAKVKATGDVKDVGGKLELTATSIELAN